MRRAVSWPLGIVLARHLVTCVLCAGTAAARIAAVDLPLRMIPAGDGYLVATSSGYAEHSLVAVDMNTRQVTQRLTFPSLWYGLAINAGHSFLVASSGHSLYVISWEKGHFGAHFELALSGCLLPSGIAVAPDGLSGYVACNQSHSLRRVRLNDGAVLSSQAVGSYPYAVSLLPGNQVAVASWGSASVSILAGEDLRVLGQITVGSHPTDILGMDLDTLAVACSDSDEISFVSLSHKRETARLKLSAGRLRGLQPDALA